jgi:chromosomal replication initiation ATPase DnaA
MDNREHDSRSGEIAGEVGGGEESVHDKKHQRDSHKASTGAVEVDLKTYPATPPGSHRRLRQIAEAASEYWGITVAEMKAKDRRLKIVWPRSVCMYLGLKAGYSSNEVAKWWHRKNHGTVLNARDTVQALLDTREAYKTQYRQFVIFVKKYNLKH